MDSDSSKSRGHYYLARAFDCQGNLDLSIYHFQQAIRDARRFEEHSVLVKSYEMYLRILHQSGYPLDSLLLVSDTAIDLATRIDHFDVLLQLYLSRGMAFAERGQFEQALENYNHSLGCLPRANRKSSAVAIYNEMANLMGQMDQPDKALEYYQDALHIADSTGWVLGKSVILNNIADNYVDAGNYEEAEAHFLESIALKRSLGNETNLSVSLCQYGRLLMEQRKYEQARLFVDEGLVLANRNSYYNGIQICLLCSAELSGQVGDIRGKIQTALTGIEVVEEQGSLDDLPSLYEKAYQGYAEVGNYQQAFTYLKSYAELEDSIRNMRNLERVEELEINFRLKEASMQNALLLEREKQTQLKLQRRQLLLYSVIFFSAIVIFAISWFGWQKIRLNHSLNQLVEERTEALQRTVEDLEKANEELTHFSYITSHDLKEPLRNINGFSALLERSLGERLAASETELLANIRQSTHQMNRLIEDVMQFSLISKDMPQPTETSLGAILEEVKYTLQVKLQEKSGVIELADDISFTGSPTHLKLILSNLCHNGLHYNESKQPQVWVCGKAAGQKVTISVKDNGIGIAEAYRDQIFVMFKRLHSRAEYQGTGLGLPITKRLVEQLGGKISVNSTLGEGSTFIVTLPKMNV